MYLLIMTTYCMNKRGFDCALSLAIARCLFADSFLQLALFFSLFLLQVAQAPYAYFLSFFFLYPIRSGTTYLYQYLFYTTTPRGSVENYPSKIIFNLLDSFAFKKIYITIYLFMCLTHVAHCTKTCMTFVGPW